MGRGSNMALSKSQLKREESEEDTNSLRFIQAIFDKVITDFAGQNIHSELSISSRPELGDLSSNAAMILAKRLQKNPKEIASSLVEILKKELGETIEDISIAGPGFINIFLSDSWYQKAASHLDTSVVPIDKPEKTLVEFVSANPTGPLTIASGRHAAYGDALANVLAAIGNPVDREYYINDYGNQINRFTDSIAARMRGEAPPEDGYQGAYISELADRAIKEGIDPSDKEILTEKGLEWMLESIRGSLDNFGVRMDGFFSEKSLHQTGAVEQAIDKLVQSGRTYEKDGAIWFKTTEFGDDKDRVLIRENGEPTYFGADIAYHINKMERGNKSCINTLGADHHGYISRMEAVFRSLPEYDSSFEAPIIQMVSLIEGGEKVKVSKRDGNIVTLDELVDDIGKDATRWFMLSRSQDSPINIDLDLARQQSSDNPVYYVQYAHARIQSILFKKNRPDKVKDKQVEINQAEKDLILSLSRFSDEVNEAAVKRSPHKICSYAYEVANRFNAFYRDSKVIDAGSPELENYRLNIYRATAETIKDSLNLLGISAPNKM